MHIWLLQNVISMYLHMNSGQVSILNHRICSVACSAPSHCLKQERLLPIGTNFSEILIKIDISVLKMHLKMSSATCHFVQAAPWVDHTEVMLYGVFIHQIDKSQNAPESYPIISPFRTEMDIFCSEWWIMGYGTVLLWELQNLLVYCLQAGLAGAETCMNIGRWSLKSCKGISGIFIYVDHKVTATLFKWV